MHLLLITPPLTQINTAYPATEQLTGYLRRKGISCDQMDLSIELIDIILTKECVSQIFDMAEGVHVSGKKAMNIKIILSNKDFYTKWVEPVKRFLQGRDSTFTRLFANPQFWANQKRMPNPEDLEWDYGTSGTFNQAQYLCTLFVEDIGNVIQQCISTHFEMVRYAEKLCRSLSDFTPLEEELAKEPNLIDQWMLELLEQKISETSPTHLGLSIPFPGNLYGGLRCAKFVKQKHPEIRITMGGGYVSTELRQLSDPRIFKYVDTITFDDGELPLERLLTNGELVRTMRLGKDGNVERINFDSNENVAFSEIGTPCLDGIHTELYLDTADTANPMQQLWSNGHWNKMMLAHGCYWAKCTFCDTTLDYIHRYDHASANIIADRMEGMMKQSGISGFHFVDEAAPPAVLRNLSEEILNRKMTVSYWTNIRFESAYTNELCFLMAQSGCIAVSGGIEVASERVLKLINKGISVKSVRETLRNFANNGIMVHAYLMYGFPSQTERELYESLDTVRQLFEDGLIQSAFWHRYAMTYHSISGQNPQQFGAKHVSQPTGTFANNEIPFICNGSPDWNKFERGLNLATYNFMRGTGFDVPIKQWFR
ncbi:MAG: radical SAM protein [Bacteroidales bacterium]|nr:radical SAM protein [Bacteroidales bacterium]